MADVTFRYGEDITMANYTPAADTPAGSVVVVQDSVGITHRPIKANQLGALGVQGGIYAGTADAVIPVGVHVYWDAAAKKVTETIGANKYLGKSTKASTAVDTPVEFIHLQPTSTAAGS